MSSLKNLIQAVDFKKIVRSVLQNLKKFKNFKKFLKNNDFRFTVIAYPVCIFGYLYLENYFKTYRLNENQLKWYSTVVFIALSILVLITVYELLDKKLFHKIQGDKLKMKQGQDWRNVRK